MYKKKLVSLDGSKRADRDQTYWYSLEMKIVIKLLHTSGHGVKESFFRNDLVSYQPAATG
jgi:hypothetical protein